MVVVVVGVGVGVGAGVGVGVKVGVDPINLEFSDGWALAMVEASPMGAFDCTRGGFRSIVYHLTFCGVHVYSPSNSQNSQPEIAAMPSEAKD